MLTKELLAEQLTGAEYPPRYSKELTQAAKAAGLVICYGASDDLVEFEGAIYDEIGAWNGTSFRIDSLGLVPSFDDIDKNKRATLKAFFEREKLPSYEVEALWNPGGGYSWQFKTDLPHATFEIVEDGGPFCRGIVFELPREGGEREGGDDHD